MSEAHIFPVEKAAKLHSEQRRSRQPFEPLVRLVAPWKPAALLDVGVGTGYFAIPLAEALPRARVVGLDSEPKMLELARARAEEQGLGDRLELSATGRHGLDAPDRSFDLVLMAQLYHELSDRPRHLAEVRRVLRAGGRLVIVDWDKGAGDGSHGPPDGHRVARADAEAELRRAGFANIEAHDLYDATGVYTLVATSG